MDIRSYNRTAWDYQVESQNPWTVPVDAQTIAAAREGRWEILLTPTIPVPRDWFPALEGADVLCLASGGGPQGPVLAAAGARVAVYDNSPRPLAQDRMVAEGEGLSSTTIEGDVRGLAALEDASVDLIVHPVSNVFVPEIRPVWREAFRVLRPGGLLLAGFTNPDNYIFDFEKIDNEGVFEVRFSLPYSDTEHLDEAAQQRLIDAGRPFEFSHTWDDQIGGQLEAGFVLTGFYMDRFPKEEDPLSRYMDTFVATRAVKVK